MGNFLLPHDKKSRNPPLHSVRFLLKNIYIIKLTNLLLIYLGIISM